MLFSSNIFIFVFLPAVIFVYYVILKKSRKLQNVFLCFASLFFYAWGEPKFVLVMLLSIIMNWIFGILVDKYRNSSAKAKIIIGLDILFNLTIIFIFKYLMFALENINSLFGASLKVPEIALPIGISFFTFQAISYVIDVYRRNGEVQKNLLNVGLYISFFPQLIAGPIVRYQTISDQIANRRESWDDFSKGTTRFVIGLGKKVLLSNSMAYVADAAFNAVAASDADAISTGMAWLGIIAYTLQIYFDFSGYSDMAIGLGRMFGFHFLENFNYPYISKSATEFWRRWHISLGSWFRDYVYIPLGGSRVDTKLRHVFNLFVVWMATGVWHGANWTFIAWGLMWGALIIAEKLSGISFDNVSKKTDWIKHIYLIFFVLIGWVVFRAENIGAAFEYYKCMFSIGSMPFIDNMFLEYFRQYAVYFGFGILFSMPVAKIVGNKVKSSFITDMVYAAIIVILFVVAVSFIVKGSYNPFIYFNF